MKVLFVSGSSANYYTFDDVVRELCARGHNIRLVMYSSKEGVIADDALQRTKKDFPELVVEPMVLRGVLTRRFMQYLRETLNFAHVLNNEETRQWDVKKWMRFFPPYLQKVFSKPAVRAWLKNQNVQKSLRVLEQSFQIVPAVRRHIQQQIPDILVVMPLMNPNSVDVEYLKAAKQLGIPVLYSMPSWDNISTKGTFHGDPDYGVVWNDALANELSRNHDFDRRKIFFTGAPRFDHLIDNVSERLLPRSEFCHMAGLDESKDYILYVGSTFLVTNDITVNRDESVLMLGVADALANDERTRNINVLVRPHPTSRVVIETLRANPRPNLVVFPATGEIPDTEEKREKYHNTIFYSLAVVGVNTTAFLEASALDKPCITLRTPEFGETQELAHFHHLEDADFLDVAAHVNEVVDLVDNLRKGKDTRHEKRHAFVKNFLRPCGKSAVTAYIEILGKIVDMHSQKKEQRSIDG